MLRNILFALKAGIKAICVFLMISLFPGKLKENAKKMEKEQNLDKLASEDGKMTPGWKMFKGIFDIMYSQSFHVQKGDTVPSNIALVDLDSGSKVNLKELCTRNVPLILNFGSCT